MPAIDPFPASDFDPWAETYDQDVLTQNRFPFDGYERVLQTVLELASPTPDMSILDLGTGTGNLAVRFAQRGCSLWCTDFSPAMLDKARQKLPGAHFVLHDLRTSLPEEFNRQYDRIVSAYVFHHLELEQKVKLCTRLVSRHLKANGKLIIADLSFQTEDAMNVFARSVGELWEKEPYWIADRTIPALRDADLNVAYKQVSSCAGVYAISAAAENRY